MKRFLYSSIFLLSFLIGASAVSLLISPRNVTVSESPINDEESSLKIISDPPDPSLAEPRDLPDDVWIANDETRVGDTVVRRICDYEWDGCRLLIYRNGRRVKEVNNGSPSLEYGFYNFLGGEKNQLVVHTYSGGSHCCHDYYVLTLGKVIQTIYSSDPFDSANEIGSNLRPVDIDGDGVLEILRRVETFAYFYSSYADSNKPTAIFAFDRRSGRYDLANKKFPQYILDDTKRGNEWFSRNSPELSDLDRRYIVRMTFLNQVYAGQEKLAWKYFDENYDFVDRDNYRREVKKEFRKDPTYRSIYR